MFWVSTGCTMGWLQVQRHFCWPVERKDCSSLQKGKVLVVCEELNPINTCLRHLHHMSLVCRGHHDSTEGWIANSCHLLPRGTEGLCGVICQCSLNRGRLQSECNSWLHRNNTAIDYSWGQQCGKSLTELSWTSWEGTANRLSEPVLGETLN